MPIYFLKDYFSFLSDLFQQLTSYIVELFILIEIKADD
jgi:hypothetical protein